MTECNDVSRQLGILNGNSINIFEEYLPFMKLDDEVIVQAYRKFAHSQSHRELFYEMAWQTIKHIVLKSKKIKTS